MIEQGRKFYSMPGRYSEPDILFLIKEDGKWKKIAKDWPYIIWKNVCKRGGLVEAGELTVEGKGINTIEEYVKLYREKFDEGSIPDLAALFKDFKRVDVKITCNEPLESLSLDKDGLGFLKNHMKQPDDNVGIVYTFYAKTAEELIKYMNAPYERNCSVEYEFVG